MEKELRFEVAVTAGDLWQFLIYHSYGGMMGAFNVLFTMAALFLLMIRWNQLAAEHRLLLVFCALIFTVLQPLLLYHKARRQVKAPMMRDSMVLTFTETGLQVEQAGQQMEMSWEEMGRMDKKSTMVILYRDRIHAFLLPKRVMGEQEDALYEMAGRHLPKERRRGF